jgi:hypothetical protein
MKLCRFSRSIHLFGQSLARLGYDSRVKSPFPGMDPYLELWWRDIHHTLCTYARDSLQPQLGGGLKARVDERLVVETDDTGRSIYPDVRIVESGWLKEGDQAVPEAPGVAAVAESLVVQIESEPARQAFIHIIDIRNDNRLIIAIEFLSPSNKLPGDGREQYVQKQKDTCEAGAGLVEIDLVRAGKRPTLAQSHLPARRNQTYQVCIYRPWKPSQCQVICIPLAARLPTIPIPLRPKDAEVALDLQLLIDQAYRNGAYGDELDYSKLCQPPLGDAEAGWAKELLRRK